MAKEQNVTEPSHPSLLERGGMELKRSELLVPSLTLLEREDALF